MPLPIEIVELCLKGFYSFEQGIESAIEVVGCPTDLIRWSVSLPPIIESFDPRSPFPIRELLAGPPVHAIQLLWTNRRRIQWAWEPEYESDQVEIAIIRYLYEQGVPARFAAETADRCLSNALRIVLEEIRSTPPEEDLLMRSLDRMERMGLFRVAQQHRERRVEQWCAPHPNWLWQEQRQAQAIGTVRCAFNARSPYLRCTVNPSGPCEGCGHFELRSAPKQNPPQGCGG